MEQTEGIGLMSDTQDQPYRNKFGLTKQQEAFAQSVLVEKSYSDAYRANYDCSNMEDNVIHVKASELTKHGKVSVRIAELRDRAESVSNVTMDRIIREYERIAFQDVTQVVGEDGKIVNFKDLTDDQRASISGVKVSTTVIGGTEDTAEVTEIKTYNKNDALEKLTRILGGFDKDNTQKRDIYVKADEVPNWIDEPKPTTD